MPDDSSNHCSGRQVPADQFQDPFVPDPGGQPAHQPVVVDSVEGNYDTLPTSTVFLTK